MFRIVRESDRQSDKMKWNHACVRTNKLSRTYEHTTKETGTLKLLCFQIQPTHLVKYSNNAFINIFTPSHSDFPNQKTIFEVYKACYRCSSDSVVIYSVQVFWQVYSSLIYFAYFSSLRIIWAYEDGQGKVEGGLPPNQVTTLFSRHNDIFSQN